MVVICSREIDSGENLLTAILFVFFRPLPMNRAYMNFA